MQVCKDKIHTSLNTSYPRLKWPQIGYQEREVILNLLCDLLTPIGRHRSDNVTPSRGKRAMKRKRKQDKLRQPATQSVDAIAPEQQVPEILPYVTIGFNSTTRLLEALTKARGGDKSIPRSHCDAVFAPFEGKSDILYAHFPSLCRSTSKATIEGIETRLVPLPAGAEERLAIALGLPRVGPIGLKNGAPKSAPLMEYVRHYVPRVAKTDSDGPQEWRYLPTQVKML